MKTATKSQASPLSYLRQHQYTESCLLIVQYKLIECKVQTSPSVSSITKVLLICPHTKIFHELEDHIKELQQHHLLNCVILTYAD